MTDELLQDHTLFEIEKLMNKNGRSLREFPTIPFQNMVTNSFERNSLIMEEMVYDVVNERNEHMRLLNGLNTDQRNAYDAVCCSVYNNHGQFFFVYGCGGTGKTILWKTILSRVRSDGKIAIAVASSGIAALLLKCGRTAHSRFKILIQINKNSSCEVKQGSPLAELLQQMSLINWDEAPIAHRHTFEAVDRMLSDIRRARDPDAEHKIFGGETMVLDSDFRQILPVVPRGKRGDIVSALVSKSELWKHCRLLTLSENMRVRNSTCPSLSEFTKWLLELGDGKLPGVSIDSSPNSCAPSPNPYAVHVSSSKQNHTNDYRAWAWQ